MYIAGPLFGGYELERCRNVTLEFTVKKMRNKWTISEMLKKKKKAMYA